MGHLDAFHLIVALVYPLLAPQLVPVHGLGQVDYIFARLAFALCKRHPLRRPQHLPALAPDPLLVICPLSSLGLSIGLKRRVLEEGPRPVGKRQRKLPQMRWDRRMQQRVELRVLGRRRCGGECGQRDRLIRRSRSRRRRHSVQH